MILISFTCSLFLIGSDPLDMTAQVTNPSGRTEDAEIIDKDDNRYVVRFVPTQDGVHTVSVKNKGIHVSGTVNQINEKLPFEIHFSYLLHLKYDIKNGLN